MSDEVVTHDEVLRWLSDDVRRALKAAERERELAVPPEQRGWATAGEVATGLPGEWIAVHELSAAEPYYLPGRRP